MVLAGQSEVNQALAHNVALRSGKAGPASGVRPRGAGARVQRIEERRLLAYPRVARPGRDRQGRAVHRCKRP